VVHRQSPSHGLTTPVDRLMRCHPLTLIVFPGPAPEARASSASPGLTGCVCLHALSSFQRTDHRCVLDAPPRHDRIGCVADHV